MAAGDINLVIRYDNGNIEAVAKEAEDEMDKAGKTSGKNFQKGFTAGIPNILGTIAKVGAAVAAVGSVVLFKSIQGAIEQEDAVNRLAGSLRATGDFSQEALADLEDFASGLQNITKIGDETLLGQLSLAKGFGATNEQAKQIVSAAADMSVALGIDLESATRNVSKTLGGYAGELGEVIPELKNFTQEQLKSGSAIELIAKQFQGLAQNELKTFGGALAQTKNSFGDLLEEIGFLVTKNPLVVKALNGISTIFKNLGAQVKQFAETFNVFDDLVDPILKFNDLLINNIAAPLELIVNIGKIVFSTLVTGVNTVIAGFGALGGVIGSLLDKFGLLSGVSQGLKDFAETSSQVLVESAAETGAAYENIFDFNVTDKLSKGNEDLKVFFAEQRAIIEEEGSKTQESLNNTADVAKDKSFAVATSISDIWKGLSFSIQESAKITEATAKQTAAIIKGSLVKGISGGIQNITQSLIDGENVFKNFGNFLFGLFGDLAIQLGSFWIAQGIAVVAANAVSGTGAIVAGAALTAVGTLLKSFAGGAGSGGGSSAPSGGASVASTSFASDDTLDQDFLGSSQEQAETQTVVNLTVEGNSFGNEEFARQVAESISEEGGKQGIVFNNFQTV